MEILNCSFPVSLVEKYATWNLCAEMLVDHADIFVLCGGWEVAFLSDISETIKPHVTSASEVYDHYLILFH